MRPQHLFDLTLELPISLGALLCVVQGGACAAEETRSCALRERRVVHHFFFWDSESLRVISPTNRNSSSRSRLSLTNSRTDGTPSALLPSHPYTVVSGRRAPWRLVGQ